MPDETHGPITTPAERPPPAHGSAIRWACNECGIMRDDVPDGTVGVCPKCMKSMTIHFIGPLDRMSRKQVAALRKQAETVEHNWKPPSIAIAYAVGFLLGRGYDEEALDLNDRGWPNTGS